MHSTLVRRPSRLLAVAALFAVALAACSGDADGPSALDQTMPIAEPPAVLSLSLTDSGSWGHGRAIWAGSSADGAVVVVTTAGVFRVADSATEPVEIDRFDRQTQVTSVAISDDGSALAIASGSPGSIRRYDLTAPRLEAEYDLPVGVGLRSVSIRSSDGALLADTSVGPIVWLDEDLASPIKSVEVVAAGRSAVLGDGSTVTPVAESTDFVIDRGGVVEQQVLALATGGVLLDAQASPDGSIVAFSVLVGSDAFEATGLIVLLDAATLDQLATIETSRPLGPYAWSLGVEHVAWTDEESMFVADRTGRLLTEPTPVESPIETVMAGRADFVTASRNGEILRWEPGSVEPVIVDEGDLTLAFVEVINGGRSVVAVDFFGLVTMWNLDGDFLEWSDDRFAVGEATSVAVTPSGDAVGVASSSGRVAVLDEMLAPSWEFVADAVSPWVGTVQFDPSSGALVTGLAQRVGEFAFDDSVAMWDIGDELPRFEVGGEASEVVGCSFFVSRAAFTGDGSLLAVASHDYSVEIVDVAAAAVVHVLAGPSTVLDLAFSPDGDLLVASYDDSSVTVWDAHTFEVRANYLGGAGGYYAFDVLPDSATLAVVDVTGSVSLVDLMTGALVRPLEGGSLRTSAIAVSADGGLVAVPTSDAGIAVWATQSGELLSTAYGHAGNVTDLAFSPDGTWLVSSALDGTVHRWSLDATTDDS